jgi:hypothetical protein
LFFLRPLPPATAESPTPLSLLVSLSCLLDVAGSKLPIILALMTHTFPKGEGDALLNRARSVLSALCPRDSRPDRLAEGHGIMGRS